jgi:hypothetical protein
VIEKRGSANWHTGRVSLTQNERGGSKITRLKSVEVREGRKGERGRVRVGMRASERAEERKSDG